MAKTSSKVAVNPNKKPTELAKDIQNIAQPSTQLAPQNNQLVPLGQEPNRFISNTAQSIAPLPPPPTINVNSGVSRDPNGNIVGVTIDGKDYFGLNPRDVEEMTKADIMKKKGGQFTQAYEQGAILAQQQEQAGNKEVTPLTPEQMLLLQQGVNPPLENINPDLTRGEYARAAGSALAYGGKAAPYGAIAGGAIGSVIPVVGTAVGTAAGSAIFAVAGGIYGAASSIFSSIAEDRTTIAEGRYNNFVFSKSRVNEIMRAYKTGAISRDDAIQAYMDNLNNIHRARDTIYAQSKKLNGERLTKANTDLTNIDIWLTNEPTIQRPQFIALLQNINSEVPSLTEEQYQEANGS